MIKIYEAAFLAINCDFMLKMITALIHMAAAKEMAAANELHQPIGSSSCQAGFAECTVLVFQGIIQCQKSLCAV